MIFDSAVVEAGAVAVAGVDAEDIAEVEVAGGGALEVAGPLTWAGVLGSVMTPAAVEDIAELVLGAALPFPAVELHPATNSAAAAKPISIDGWSKDLVGMRVTLTM